MSFSREIHHTRRLVLAKDRIDRLPVGDVGCDEMDTRVFEHIVKVCEIARVGESINNDEPPVGIRQRKTDKVRTDEPCTACNNHCIHHMVCRTIGLWGRYLTLKPLGLYSGY